MSIISEESSLTPEQRQLPAETNPLYALMEDLADQGYFDFKEVQDHGLCAICQFMFTYGLVTGLDNDSYRGRYCFHTEDEAIEALRAWDGIGDPSGNWIVYKGKGGQRSNPNHAHQ